jgi:hypothetical protein
MQRTYKQELLLESQWESSMEVGVRWTPACESMNQSWDCTQKSRQLTEDTGGYTADWEGSLLLIGLKLLVVTIFNKYWNKIFNKPNYQFEPRLRSLHTSHNILLFFSKIQFFKYCFRKQKDLEVMLIWHYYLPFPNCEILIWNPTLFHNSLLHYRVGFCVYN